MTTKKLMATLGALAMCTGVMATEYTWNPTVMSEGDYLWETAANWIDAEGNTGVPGGTDSATFNADATVKMANAVNLNELRIADGKKVSLVGTDSYPVLQLTTYTAGAATSESPSTLALTDMIVIPGSKAGLDLTSIVDINGKVGLYGYGVSSSESRSITVSGNLTGTGEVYFRNYNTSPKSRAYMYLSGDNSGFKGVARYLSGGYDKTVGKNTGDPDMLGKIGYAAQINFSSEKSGSAWATWYFSSVAPEYVKLPAKIEFGAVICDGNLQQTVTSTEIIIGGGNQSFTTAVGFNRASNGNNASITKVGTGTVTYTGAWGGGSSNGGVLTLKGGVFEVTNDATINSIVFAGGALRSKDHDYISKFASTSTDAVIVDDDYLPEHSWTSGTLTDTNCPQGFTKRGVGNLTLTQKPTLTTAVTVESGTLTVPSSATLTLGEYTHKVASDTTAKTATYAKSVVVNTLTFTDGCAKNITITDGDGNMTTNTTAGFAIPYYKADGVTPNTIRILSTRNTGYNNNALMINGELKGKYAKSGDWTLTFTEDDLENGLDIAVVYDGLGTYYIDYTYVDTDGNGVTGVTNPNPTTFSVLQLKQEIITEDAIAPGYAFVQWSSRKINSIPRTYHSAITGTFVKITDQVAGVKKDGVSTYYTSFADAVAALEEGNTLKVLKAVDSVIDIGVDCTIWIDQGVTLNEADITIASGKTVTIDGLGTYSLTEKGTTVAPALNVTLADSWKGIVAINGGCLNGGNLSTFAKGANSTVMLNGTYGYLASGATVEANLIIGEKGWYITNGYSKSALQFTVTGKVSGTGTLDIAIGKFGSANNYVFTGDVSGWTGTINASQRYTQKNVYFTGNPAGEDGVVTIGPGFTTTGFITLNAYITNTNSVKLAGAAKCGTGEASGIVNLILDAKVTADATPAVSSMKLVHSDDTLTVPTAFPSTVLLKTDVSGDDVTEVAGTSSVTYKVTEADVFFVGLTCTATDCEYEHEYVAQFVNTSEAHPFTEVDPEDGFSYVADYDTESTKDVTFTVVMDYRHEEDEVQFATINGTTTNVLESTVVEGKTVYTLPANSWSGTVTIYTLKKATPEPETPTFPTEWSVPAGTSAAVTNAYVQWVNAGNSTTKAYAKECFLLGLESSDTEPTQLAAESITITGTTVTIDMNHALENAKGVVFVRRGSAVTGMTTIEEITKSTIGEGGVFTFKNVTDPAHFYQIGVDFVKPSAE